MKIIPFDRIYAQDLIDLVLYCQNDGTRPEIGINEQKDLIDIENYYFKDGENFWLACDNAKLAGSIGLKIITPNIGIVKKFFVYKRYRGAPLHTGQLLFKHLLEYAKKQKLCFLILDTPKNTARAHKFYLKAGFEKIDHDKLPCNYPTPYPIDLCDFFIMKLDGILRN